MFSGIVCEIGTVEKLESKNGLLEIIVSCSSIDIKIGDSVAVDGSCQTVVEVTPHSFKIQSTQETLSKTNFSKLKTGSKVNLETSLRVGDKIDGHLVLGHIDACGEVTSVINEEENKTVEILFPSSLSNFIAPKGSISVNGVSLTICEVKNNRFNFSLIPYSRDNTNLGLIKIGDLVNLEVDLISRYLVNYLDLENKRQLVKK